MSRYVVLRHETPPNYARPLHWDLMLEADGALWTWALEEPPAAGPAIVAWALQDHRLEYLEREGPLGGDRGSVSRWDRGAFVLAERQFDRVVVDFREGKLAGMRGTLTLESRGEVAVSERWSLVIC